MSLILTLKSYFRPSTLSPKHHPSAPPLRSKNRPAPSFPPDHLLQYSSDSILRHRSHIAYCYALPSASSSLRASLLSLIATTVPAIARHENSFLPLINTLWPEVVSRLDDEENHIVANALAVVTVFCEHARDFMRSRIIQLWPRLEEIHTSIWGARHTESYKSLALKRSAKHTSSLLQSPPGAGDDLSVASASSATYNDLSKKLLQSTLVACLVAIVRFVQITPEMIDEALAMLRASLQEDDVRSAFAEENSDALWLTELRANAVTVPASPGVPAGVQWQFATAPS